MFYLPRLPACGYPVHTEKHVGHEGPSEPYLSLRKVYVLPRYEHRLLMARIAVRISGYHHIPFDGGIERDPPLHAFAEDQVEQIGLVRVYEHHLQVGG